MPDREPRDVVAEDVLALMAKRASGVAAYRPGDAILIYCDEAGNLRQRLVPMEEYLAPASPRPATGS